MWRCSVVMFARAHRSMLRAASLATLAVPRLLRSIASGTWRERSIARAGAARTIVDEVVFTLRRLTLRGVIVPA